VVNDRGNYLCKRVRPATESDITSFYEENCQPMPGLAEVHPVASAVIIERLLPSITGIPEDYAREISIPVRHHLRPTEIGRHSLSRVSQILHEANNLDSYFGLHVFYRELLYYTEKLIAKGEYKNPYQTLCSFLGTVFHYRNAKETRLQMAQRILNENLKTKTARAIAEKRLASMYS